MAFGPGAKRLVLFVAAMLAARPGLSQQASLEEKWRALFAQTSPAAAEEHIDAVLAACGDSPAALRKLFACDSAYPQLGGGLHRRATTVVDGETRYDVEYVVRVPGGYSPVRSCALLLAAHGQGGSGASITAMMQRGLGAEVEKYIIVAPTLPGPRRYAGAAYQEQAYLKPLAWARLNLNVDDDRIYVSGHSLGGHCTWHLATMFPHLFAAAVPMAGVPLFEGSPYTSNSYLENLANLPVWAIWGELDQKGPGTLSNVHFCRMAAERLRQLGNSKFEGTELPGVGHAGWWPKPEAYARYLTSHKRLAAPEKLVHFFHRARHGRAYYVEAIRLARDELDFSRRPQPKLRVQPGESLAEAAIRTGKQVYDKSLFKIWADLDKGANAMSIRASGVSAVRVYATEGMFDLSRPVTLRFAGRSWTGGISASARCMLTHYAATRDATAVICNEVDVDSAGKVLVRFGPSGGGETAE